MVARCVLALLLLTPTIVAAQHDADAQARVHFQAGALYYETGDYEGAAREYQRAYALSPRPLLQFNLSLALEHLGQWQQAADALQRYLQDEVDIPSRARLEVRLARLRSRATSDGEVVASSDVVETEDHPAPVQPSVVRIERPAEGSSSIGVGPIVSFVVAGAGLASFALFAGLASAEDARLASSCGRNAGRTCTESDTSSLSTFTQSADISLAVGASAAVIGLIWALLSTRNDDSTTANASASRNGFAFNVQQRF